MEDNIASDKLAWEQAFDNRTADWGDDVAPLRRSNGREILSLVKNSVAESGVL